MVATFGADELSSLKSEFKAYLREANPKWNDASVSTIVSDAFYALNNDVGIDFWGSLMSEESMLATRDKIENFLFVKKHSDKAYERANGY